MHNNIDFKVGVECITYNHSKYILDTLNGFVSQKTNFPFLCIIVDDASTDGEQEIIKNYLDENFNVNDNTAYFKETEVAKEYFSQHKDNHNCYFAIFLLKENHYRLHKSKDVYFESLNKNIPYDAICEGDDYWTNSSKLQLQFDFLESNPDFTLCFHKVNCKAEEGRKFIDIFGFLQEKEYSIDEMLSRWTVPTCSILYRSNILSKTPKNSKFTYGDNVLILTCLTYGKMFCIGKTMGIYRLVPTGWTGSTSVKEQMRRQISQLEGLIESFEICKNKILYNKLKMFYFKYLYFLKKDREFEEYNDFRGRYIHKFGLKNMFIFPLYYYLKRIKDLINF